MKEKLMLHRFNFFGGRHCQTAALKKLFDYHGINLSEEMLLGLGGGAGFIYWYMRRMNSPFIGTRFGKGDEVLINIAERMSGGLRIVETASAKKGYEELKSLLRAGEPACIFADMVYLPYMALPEGAHFGGHTIVSYGLDEETDKVYISDRANKSLTISIADLNKARSSKFPPFPAKNKIVRISYPKKIRNLDTGIKQAIKDCCNNMINPPIKNIGLEGIKKWAGLVPKWPSQFKQMNLLGCLFGTFINIEIGGTGGSGFRLMYAQFLKEASLVLNNPDLAQIAKMFEKSAKQWSEIAQAALPDWWPALKRIRELALDKNRIFEEQKPKALEEMIKINQETNGLMKKAVDEIAKSDLTPLLSGLKDRILNCYQVEKEAFEALANAIK